MTLTKADLADLLFEKVGLNKREAKDMVESFFEEVRMALEHGDGVKLSDLADRMGMTSVAMRQLLHRVRVLLLECVRRRLSVENPS